MEKLSDGHSTLIAFLIKVYELENDFYRSTDYCRVIFMNNFDRGYKEKTPLYKIIKDIKSELKNSVLSTRKINKLSFKIFQNQDLHFNLKGESCKR